MQDVCTLMGIIQEMREINDAGFDTLAIREARGDGLKAKKMALDRSTCDSCLGRGGEAACAYRCVWADSDGRGDVRKIIKRMKQMYMS